MMMRMTQMVIILKVTVMDTAAVMVLVLVVELTDIVIVVYTSTA